VFESFSSLLKEVSVFSTLVGYFICSDFTIILKEVICLVIEMLFNGEVCSVTIESVHCYHIGSLDDLGKKFKSSASTLIFSFIKGLINLLTS